MTPETGKESAMKNKWIDSKDASLKVCPFSMSGDATRPCKTSDCMAWRKMPVGNEKFSSPEVREANARMGNCKLIDKE